MKKIAEELISPGDHDIGVECEKEDYEKKMNFLSEKNWLWMMSVAAREGRVGQNIWTFVKIWKFGEI